MYLKANKNKKSGAKTPVTHNKSGQNKNVRSTKSLNLNRNQNTQSKPLESFKVLKASTSDGVIVHGRELISALNTSQNGTGFGGGGLTNAAGSIGLVPSQFARLINIAAAYEMYKFHKIKCTFQSNQPTTQAGVAQLAIDFDVSDNAVTTTVSMQRNKVSGISNVYSDLTIHATGKDACKPRYFCSGGADSTEVDQGVIRYAFEGVTGQANVPVGYLIVEYEVEFFVPC